MSGLTGVMRASKDMNIYVFIFSHSQFTPLHPAAAHPLTLPEEKECALARVKIGYVIGSRPIKHAWIVVAEGYRCWENRIGENRIQSEACERKASFSTLPRELELFVIFQALCVLDEVSFM